MAIVLPLASSPSAAPAGAGTRPAPLVAASGCTTCCVRHYCAMYAPTSASPPANCPFGPGPDPTRRD